MKDLKGDTWFLIWSISIIFTNLFIFFSYTTQRFFFLIFGLMFLQISYIFYTNYFYIKKQELEEQNFYRKIASNYWKEKRIKERQRK